MVHIGSLYSVQCRAILSNIRFFSGNALDLRPEMHWLFAAVQVLPEEKYIASMSRTCWNSFYSLCICDPNIAACHFLAGWGAMPLKYKKRYYTCTHCSKLPVSCGWVWGFRNFRTSSRRRRSSHTTGWNWSSVGSRIRTDPMSRRKRIRLMDLDGSWAWMQSDFLPVWQILSALKILCEDVKRWQKYQWIKYVLCLINILWWLIIILHGCRRGTWHTVCFPMMRMHLCRARMQISIHIAYTCVRWFGNYQPGCYRIFIF